MSDDHEQENDHEQPPVHDTESQADSPLFNIDRHMVPCPSGRWLNGNAVKVPHDQFLMLGFDDMGFYDIENTAGHHLVRIYHHPTWGIIGNLSETESKKHFTEIHWSIGTLLNDGRVLVYVDNSQSNLLDPPPWHLGRSQRGQTVAAVIPAFLEEARSLGATLIRREDVIRLEDEDLFRIAMWRNSRGGVTREEIWRLFGDTHRLTPANVAGLLFKYRSAAYPEYCRGIARLLRESSSYTDEQWADIDPRLVIIHDDIDEEVLLFVTGIPYPANPGIPSDPPPPRDLVRMHAALNGWELLKTFTDPVATDVYLRPDTDDDAEIE